MLVEEFQSLEDASSEKLLLELWQELSQYNIPCFIENKETYYNCKVILSKVNCLYFMVQNGKLYFVNIINEKGMQKIVDARPMDVKDFVECCKNF